MDDPIDAFEVEGLYDDNDIKIESDDDFESDDIESDDTESDDIESDYIESDIDIEDNSDIDELNTRTKRTKRQAHFIVSHNVWTREDKRLLFNGLMENGSTDIIYLANRIRTKSPKAVRDYIANIETRARSSLKEGIGRFKTERKAPIDQWLNYLIKLSHSESFKRKDIARALKYIALFDRKTDSADIQVGDCYEVLSNLFRGDAPKQLTQDNSIFLLKNIQKLASITKDVNHSKEEEFFNAPPQKSDPKMYKNKNKIKLEEDAEVEESYLKCDDINPLKIPKHLLQSV